MIVTLSNIHYVYEKILLLYLKLRITYLFLGTKWCGAGNIAENDEDFGAYKDTDKCCQAHDYCPDIIEGYETKHNLTNPSFYTRYNFFNYIMLSTLISH